MNGYKEVRLRFTKNGPDSYRVAVLSSPKGGVSAPTSLRLALSRLRELHRQISAALLQSRSRDAEIDGELARLGEELYEAIFPPGPVREVLSFSLGAISSSEERQQGLRLCLHFDPYDLELAWLAELPWDVLRTPQGFPARYLALDQRLSIVRSLDVTQPLQPPMFVPPLRVLLVRAGARGYSGLQLQAEQDSIMGALSAIDGVECQPLDMPTRQELRRGLRDFEPHVLHFMGHGKVDEDTGSGCVYLRDEKGDPDPLRAQDIAELFGGLSDLRLVVLNACQSARGTLSVNGHGSVAAALVAGGVAAVVAMQFTISDGAARAFTEEFYTRLARRALIDDAVTEGRIAMRSKVSDSFEWCTPALYLRDEAAGVLLQPAPSRSLGPAGEKAASAPEGEVVLVRHETFSKVIMPLDLPEVQAGRVSRPAVIDQTARLEDGRRTKQDLEAAVKELAAPEGVYKRELAKSDATLVYYGFPLVPFAVLAGYMAKAARPVRVVEPDDVAKVFTWKRSTIEPEPELKSEVQGFQGGSAALVRVSVSNPVTPEDCFAVLPPEQVRLDIHFALEKPKKHVITREQQARGYARMIREVLERELFGKNEIKSIHLFAAVPVSLAFLIGQSLSSTALPRSYVYNYVHDDVPRYKWRVSLKDAVLRKPAITVFKGRV